MTNNKQQTAVEWLYNELLNSEPNILEWNKLLEQAKEMEKEQIMKAHISAGARLEDISIEAAEEYYKQNLRRRQAMTNNKQQTAVDILCGKLAMKLGIPQAITFYIDHQEEIREAKEMEKEQIEEAFANGVDDEYEWHINNVPRKNSETYYNENYGGGEQ
jgi:vacuolar-type H+-ATPase subunit H